ncbi:MAG: cytochrome c [Bacteroidetes bacterium]|nr:MAG: cytochrome c [Bacteroidota bacterium]RLD73690.1 MAG: cytochrome c [Bacteroidota bacterium]RLD89299.1 MAG: cytochrome c [Bacteroidota bacterium]
MKKLTFILALSFVVITGTSYAYLHQVPISDNENISMYVPGDDPADAKFPEGAKIYKEKCVACHQLTGLGVPNAFPPLKGSDYLLTDKKRAVKQVLNGSNEEMIVNGAKYNIPMPFQVNTHEDAVHVINYVLNAWGNDGGTITVEEVKDIKIVRP